MSVNKHTLFFVLVSLTGAVCVTASWLVLFTAPVEEVMGLAQKIFYLHVPSAIAMYAGVAMCSISSLVFLIGWNQKWDAAGRVGAELATIYCVIVLITGPIWAREAWGEAWVWDPRLTGVAVLGLILASYHLVRAVGEESPASRRLAAVLGVLAAPNGYLIHMAVRMWGGQHPTVIYESEGLDPVMRYIFLLCIAASMLLFASIAWWRLDLLLIQQRAQDLGVKVLLLDDGHQARSS